MPPLRAPASGEPLTNTHGTTTFLLLVGSLEGRPHLPFYLPLSLKAKSSSLLPVFSGKEDRAGLIGVDFSWIIAHRDLAYTLYESSLTFMLLINVYCVLTASQIPCFTHINFLNPQSKPSKIDTIISHFPEWEFGD